MFLNSSMTMTMTASTLLLFLLRVSGTLYGPRLLISHVGGSVTVKCYYLTTTANKHDRKFWCKESNYHRRCQTIISTNLFTHDDYQGRVSMEDIPVKGILQVTMTQLEKEDSNNYRCGIGKINDGLYAGVNLTVVEGPNRLKSPEMLWGKLRGSVTIPCPSESAELNMKKSFCKMRKSTCVPIADSDRSMREQHASRIVFTAKDSSGAFKVLINGLKQEDSGMYVCGTGTPESARMIQLQVIEESVFANILNDTRVTYEVQTIHASSYRYVTPEVYKERPLKLEQSLLYTVIPVLLALLVLAVTVITVLVKIRQRRKYAPNDTVVRNPEGGIPLTVQRSSEEDPKDENRVSNDEQDSAISPEKEIPIASAYCLLGHMPNNEDLREND